MIDNNKKEAIKIISEQENISINTIKKQMRKKEQITIKQLMNQKKLNKRKKAIHTNSEEYFLDLKRAVVEVCIYC